MALRLPNYLLVGNGRLATHLHYYLSQHDIPLRQWSRHFGIEFNPAAADIVLLAISDVALPEWIERPDLADKTVVHFSGAQFSEQAWGFHPLMTFSHQLYEKDFYPTIPFVADKGFPRKEIFPFLANPVYEIRPEQKTFYHALCHMAANFPALLWVQVFRHFENDLKLPHQVLGPILEKVLTNTINFQASALAGPLQRRDFKTLSLHEEALMMNPDLFSIYERWTNWAKEIQP